jgi:phage terminase small subunit
MDEEACKDLILHQIAIPGMERIPAEPFIPTKKAGHITAKMRAFVAAYLRTNDLTASAIEAGYAPKWAASIASRLVNKSQVAELIREEQEAALKRAGIDRTRALMELAKLAYYDPRKLYREDGTLKDPGEWDDATAAAIAQVETFEEFQGSGDKRRLVGFTRKVKSWDKRASLELLLKCLGVLKEQVVFPDRDGNPQSVAPRIEVVFVEAQGREMKNITGQEREDE